MVYTYGMNNSVPNGGTCGMFKTPFEKSMRRFELEGMVPTMTELACFRKDQSWPVSLAFHDEGAMAERHVRSYKKV
jgi:hypothetical protein